ncbi:hypothetical protein [Pyxidicoccus trucidator]|uniref:hypothetical protein n=1 Tax=Pyxidicoccus trucidator TaxID=2709662 RepID=UPI0019679B19|nr:hypothetical protein [Pyxidicoccus trucidator]
MSRLATLAFTACCLLAAVLPLREARDAPQGASSTAFPGWPASFEGLPLQSLPLTEREIRFAADFPGRIGRFSDGQRELVLRWVEAPTRQLHPAEDCFRGLGYAITPQPSSRGADGVTWHRFHAARGGTALEVSEAITDGAGGRWTDASAWYWSALLGRTSGPWWAVTVAERAPEDPRQAARIPVR